MITSQDPERIARRCRETESYEQIMIQCWTNMVARGGRAGISSYLLLDTQTREVELFWLGIGFPGGGWRYVKSECREETDKVIREYQTVNKIGYYDLSIGKG